MKMFQNSAQSKCFTMKDDETIVGNSSLHKQKTHPPQPNSRPDQTQHHCHCHQHSLTEHITSQCKLIKNSIHQKLIKSITTTIHYPLAMVMAVGMIGGNRLRTLWLLPTVIMLQFFLLLSQSINASAAVNILCSDPVHYGTLELLIKQAEIPNGVCDLESECDLFVRIFVDGALIGQSRISPNTNRPAFNEYFKIESVTNISTLRLVVMDDDGGQDGLTEPPDEPDEIFEIFLRIDEDILAEGRNGKQMEVDGYSLKGIGAMGRLVFGVHWDSKFASCDFETGDLSFEVKEAKIPWMLSSRGDLVKYQNVDLIGEVRVDGYLLGYTNRTLGRTNPQFSGSLFRARNVLNTFVLGVRFFSLNGSTTGLNENLCTVVASRVDQHNQLDRWFSCSNSPGDSQRIQVRIVYTWKPFYREIYQINLLESRFEYRNLSHRQLQRHVRNITLIQPGSLRNEGQNTVSTYYARSFQQTESFALRFDLPTPLSSVLQLLAQQPIELDLPLMNSTLRPPYTYTGLYRSARVRLDCDRTNVCRTTAVKRYTISEVITIGAETQAQPHWYAVWLHNLLLNFRLQLALGGVWQSNSGAGGNIKPPLIKALLQKHGLSADQVQIKSDHVLVELDGQLLASYGLDSCLHITCQSLDSSGYTSELFKVLP